MTNQGESEEEASSATLYGVPHLRKPDNSAPSKISHIRHHGIAFQIMSWSCGEALLCQQDSSFKTEWGITQHTPKRQKTKDHNSLAYSQCTEARRFICACL
jgi:hypothetical protein